ncbi:hypothetical protein A2U01_0008373, partial [Trifolium medium]|nr:hypothetical protein [Trifolium medium]
MVPNADQHDIHWDKPPLGYLKYNLDFATIQQQEKVGFTAFVRDYYDVFSMAHPSWSSSHLEPTKARLLAFYFGIIGLIFQNWNNNPP